MNMVELREYRTKVGLMIHEFNIKSTIFGNGQMLLADNIVSLDQKTEDGWYIFRVDNTNYYVKVPEHDLENEIEEVKP